MPLKNALVSANSIIHKTSKVLSFHRYYENIVTGIIQISTNSYTEDDIIHSAALINSFFDNTQQKVAVTAHFKPGFGMIQMTAHEKSAHLLSDVIANEHETFADKLTISRPYPDNHFSYLFPRICKPSYPAHPYFDQTMSALFEAGLGFKVALSWQPMAHIENKERTQGMMAVHKHHFSLLFQPDYAFHPDYVGNANDIQSVSRESAEENSVVARNNVMYSLTPNKTSTITHTSDTQQKSDNNTFKPGY